ncbi:hypothetical protein FRC07_010157 [Ceratobasidium sp. 392]|nr:hypothetical protein FRC07_010157 [Ceratobasidium sp. 392]
MDARASFFKRDVFLKFLELVTTPPRPPCGSGPRPKAASKFVREFTIALTKETFTTELDKFSEDYGLTTAQLTNADYISTITSSALHKRNKKKCPTICNILSALTTPLPPDAEGTDEIDDSDDEDEATVIGPKPPVEKHPHSDIIFQVTTMAYRLRPRLSGSQTC